MAWDPVGGTLDLRAVFWDGTMHEGLWSCATCRRKRYGITGGSTSM